MPGGVQDLDPRTADGPGVRVFADEVILPVCSPDYLARNGSLSGADTFEGHTLAFLDGQVRAPWEVFLQGTLGHVPRGARRMTFPDYALALQSAVKGQTVALGWWHVVANELALGGLVPASPWVLRTGRTYKLYVQEASARRRAVTDVRDWLLADMDQLYQETAHKIGQVQLKTRRGDFPT